MAQCFTVTNHSLSRQQWAFARGRNGPTSVAAAAAAEGSGRQISTLGPPLQISFSSVSPSASSLPLSPKPWRSNPPHHDDLSMAKPFLGRQRREGLGFKRIGGGGRGGGRGKGVARASIGFTADPRISIERATNSLLRDAASLLVFSDVLRPPPAQAFLRLLLQLRRGDDGVKLLETYGEFYRHMAQAGYASWQDFLIDGILEARNNPFATSASSSSALTPAKSVSPSLRAAAAVDLDTIQRLAVTETTLIGWIAGLVPDVRAEWKAAATGNAPPGSANRGGEDSGAASGGERRGPSAGLGFGFSASSVGGVGSVEGSKQGSEGSGGDQAEESPLNGSSREKQWGESTAQESLSTSGTAGESESYRRQWRERIAGLWRWSEAVPALEEFYSQQGTGAAAFNQYLVWSSDTFSLSAASPSPPAPASALPLSIHLKARGAIQPMIERHLAGKPARNILVYGPDGMGKTSLLMSALHAAVGKDKEEEAGEGGALQEGRGRARIVRLHRSDVKSIRNLLATIAEMPRLRFFIAIDDAQFRMGEELMLTLKAALEGFPEPWPSNALLCATSTRRDLGRGLGGGTSGAGPSVSSDSGSSEEEMENETLEALGPLGVHFGIAVTPSKKRFLSPDEFVGAVREVLEAKGVGEEEATEKLAKAKVYSERRKELLVIQAFDFVEF